MASTGSIALTARALLAGSAALAAEPAASRDPALDGLVREALDRSPETGM